jgi:hypothetical protein
MCVFRLISFDMATTQTTSIEVLNIGVRGELKPPQHKVRGEGHTFIIIWNIMKGIFPSSFPKFERGSFFNLFERRVC